MTAVDPQTLIARAREVCKNKTPGVWCAVYNNEDAFAWLAIDNIWVTGPDAVEGFLIEDALFSVAASTLVPALADALEYAEQSATSYRESMVLARQSATTYRERVIRAERELADHKAKMVDLLAHAYEKGRASNEDTDDRTSEHE